MFKEQIWSIVFGVLSCHTSLDTNWVLFSVFAIKFSFFGALPVLRGGDIVYIQRAIKIFHVTEHDLEYAWTLVHYYSTRTRLQYMIIIVCRALVSVQRTATHIVEALLWRFMFHSTRTLAFKFLYRADVYAIWLDVEREKLTIERVSRCKRMVKRHEIQ